MGRIVVDDITIFDQQADTLIKAARIAARINPLDLLGDEINISSAQLFGLDARITQTTEESPTNMQFLIDSLSSENSEGGAGIGINSLIIRNGTLSYDRLDQDKTPGQFNTNHLRLSELSAHIVANSLKADSLDVKIKRLSFKEQSDLNVKSLVCDIRKRGSEIEIDNFSLRLPHSHLAFNKTIFNIDDKNGTSPTIDKLQLHGKINPIDLRCFAPETDFDIPLNIKATISGNKKRLMLGNIDVSSTADNLALRGSAVVSENGNWRFDATRLTANRQAIGKILKSKAGINEIREIIGRLGNIDFSGTAEHFAKNYSVNGRIKTDEGVATINLLANDQFKPQNLKFSTESFNLGKTLADNRLGLVRGQIDINNIGNNNYAIKADIRQFDWNGYPYKNITTNALFANNIVSGTLSLDDPGGTIRVKGTYDLNATASKTNFEASLNKVNLSRLRITDALGDGIFDGDIVAKIGKGRKGNALNSDFDIEINNFRLQQANDTYDISHLQLSSTHDGTTNHITLNSDFANAEISGANDYRTIINSMKRMLISKIPTLSALTPTPSPAKNAISVSAEISDARLLKLVHDKQLTLTQPIIIDGVVNEANNSTDIRIIADDFIYDGTHYHDAAINIFNEGDTLMAVGNAKRTTSNEAQLSVAAKAKAFGDKLDFDIAFDNIAKHHLLGQLSTTTTFYTHNTGEPPTIATVIHPSQIRFDNETFRVEPSDIVYDKGRLLIDHFQVENKKQSLILSGFISDSHADTLRAEMKNINIDYISSLLNVRGVEFSGIASGTATSSALLDKQQAEASLMIDDFRFVGGRLGNLDLKAKWSDDERIQLNGITNDDNKAKTLIEGYISPKENALELNIETQNTRIEFLENYIGSFLHDIDARAIGKLKVYGPLDKINIAGMVTVSGDLSVMPLHTTYTLFSDTITLLPNKIIFHNDTIRDYQGNIAVVEGEVTHNYLKQFGYNVDVTADNILAFDKKEFGDDTFRGTVYASGNCHVTGGNGSTDIDIFATPQRGSIIEYNVDGIGAAGSEQSFITWNSKTTSPVSDTRNVSNKVFSSNDNQPKYIAKAPISMPAADDLRMNIQAETTSDLTLRVLMNETTGDYIDLQGTGVLLANYFNKGTFDMYGNYNVENGLYKMTIQNLLKKEFQFQPGSSIVFGGNPYYATLNLKGIYTVNGVSLADLSIGNSFASSNVRVNCLMNISGTPVEPQVEFDFEMPTASSNAQQMVRQLITSQEELNQQVIYLLTIGRFLNQGSNNAETDASAPSQTSLAMQSLLSGTVSQQINEVLSTIINVSNWNFGANISTGNEGWSNAEYEGLLSGRLLNNRLLINGQFGYRDNPNASTSFIGDFDVRYLLFPNGNLSLKVYNQSNDRYFTRNSLNTQGIGLIMKKDFSNLRDLFSREKKKQPNKKQ